MYITFVLLYGSYFCVFRFVFVFKQKTAYEMRISDWSSDVCSSDLRDCLHLMPRRRILATAGEIMKGFEMGEVRVLLQHDHMRARHDAAQPFVRFHAPCNQLQQRRERKSTRLKSSH